MDIYKKLLLLIGLCGAFGLQATDNGLTDIEEKVWIKTSDCRSMQVPFGVFPLLQKVLKVRNIGDNKNPDRLIQLGITEKTALRSSIDSKHWNNVLKLMNEPNYVLPITQEEQKEKT